METRLLAVRLGACIALGLSLASQQGLKLQNGVAGHLEVPYSPLTIPTTGLTVEAWVTYDDTTLISGYVWPTLIRANNVAQSECYFLRVDASNNNTKTLRLKVWLASNVQLSASWAFTTGQLNTWTHVAGTYDGTNARLFVNGVQVAISAAGSGPIRDTAGPLRIGKGDDEGAAGAESWNGGVDELRLWPFARTAAEIQSTMQSELSSLPGRVSTWNLNGNANDSSSTLNGTVMGTINFVANSLTLTSRPFAGGVAVGTSSSTCVTALDCSVTGLPQVGNAGFGLAGYKGPLGGPAALLLSGKSLSTPLTLLGISIWVDPFAGLISFPVTSNGLGTASLALPIPANPFLAGANLSAQYAWVDATCGPSGITASRALGFGILP